MELNVDAAAARHAEARPAAPSISAPMALLFAVACGLAVANVYYAQPLLDTLASTFGIRPATVGIVITIGVYALFGFEISPAAVIGFLTILSYALYDTTVVFDKVRENTREDGEISGRTFAESVNLAANQTLIRSINTTVVAILPVGAILFIGVPLGARTLSDISLSIFVGTIVAAYSTLFVAVPLYALLRERETPIKERDARVLAARAKAGVPA